MKTLKNSLLLAMLFATVLSCTKQDLNEDDLLDGPPPIVEIGGDGDVKNR